MKKLIFIFLMLFVLGLSRGNAQDVFVPVFDDPQIDSAMARFFGDSVSSKKDSHFEVNPDAFKPAAVAGACYTLLDDFSGYNRNPYLKDLEEAAGNLRDALPLQYRDKFKVYDFGFYLHNQSFKGFTYPEAFKELKASLPDGPYILFGKQTDSKGVYSKFWVTVKLPDVTGNGCLPDMEEQATQLLQFAVDNEYKNVGQYPNNFALSFIKGMNDLQSYLTTAQQCCQASASNAKKCVDCSNPKAIAAKLHSMGFASVKIQNIGVHPNPMLHPDIENHANLLFTIGDRQVVELGPDYVSLIDSLHQVKIDTLEIDGLKVRVYITDDDDFCSPLWQQIIDDTKNYDVVYWHHIHKGMPNHLGDEYLFSGVFYNGQINGFKGNGNERVVTNLIAALSSAVTDLLLQTVINYITDDDIKQGDYWGAVKTVNFYDVGFSFVTGFFGLDKKIGTVAQALAGATTYVLGAANYHSKKGNTYDYAWAMKDFGINFIENFISAKVGGSVGKKFSKSGFSFPAWCEVARWINKRLGTMIPGCFVAGTKITTNNGLKNIEEIQENDLVLSFDENKKSNTFARVTSVFKREVPLLSKVIVGNDTIITTPNHPFYVNDSWIVADSLTKGMKVLLFSGILSTIDTAFSYAQTSVVYNFEVETFHNYYVNSGYLVHNGCTYIDELNNFLRKNFNLPASISRVGPKTSLGAKRIGNEIHLPDGRKVNISMFEMPDFTGFTLKVGGKPMSFDVMTKSIGRDLDFKAANIELAKHIKEADLIDPVNLATLANGSTKSNITMWVTEGGQKVKKTFTWHHHENAKTMMFVEQDVHKMLTHDGGEKMKKLNSTNQLDNMAEFIFGNPIF